MSDGSIVFSAELDNKKLEQQLARTQKKIESLEGKYQKKQSAYQPAAKEAEAIGRDYDAARKRLEYMQSGNSFFTKESISQQTSEVQALETQWDKTRQRADKYREELYQCTQELDRQKQRAGEITQQLAAASQGSSRMSEASQRVGKSMDRFKMRLQEVVRSALLFTVITQGLTKVRQWVGSVVSGNEEASAAMGRLKGALLTLVQPLVGVLIPAFTVLVDLLTRLAVAAAHAMAALFGGTLQQSKDAAQALNKETAALKGTGAAAKKAGGQVAAFDELNKLSDPSSGGGGTSTAPTFDFDTAPAAADFEKILNVVKLVGAALLAWRLSGSIQELFSMGGLKKLVGAFLLLDGAIGFLRTTFDAFTNGVSWDTLFGMLGRAGELVLGLWLLFGKTGAAIGLIVTGLVMLATAFHDASENGWNLQNTLLAVAGLLAAGLGVALLTGSWIPLLIAGIAAALLAIVTTFGDGEKLIEDMKKILDGFLDFFIGSFTGDIDRAMEGMGKIFEGLKGIVGNVLDSIKNMFLSFLDWLDEKTGGRFSGIIQFVKNLVGGTLDWMKESFGGFADAFQQILGGIVTFLAGVFTGDWDKAWQGLVDIGKGAVNLLTSMVESFVNFFINGLNTLITALNRIKFTAPDWVPVLGGKSYGVNIPQIPKLKIPRLATGAVIPPNREFMAVLGDQHSGNNIETPEGLLRQIFREESGNAAILQELREILAAIREGKVMMVDRREIGAIIQAQFSATARAKGNPVISTR